MKPLPPTSNKKFWVDAEHYETTSTYQPCKHDFKRDRSLIICKKCHMGTYDPEFKVLVDNGKLIA